jgi:hypothetical protein
MPNQVATKAESQPSDGQPSKFTLLSQPSQDSIDIALEPSSGDRITVLTAFCQPRSVVAHIQLGRRTRK